MLRVVRAEDLAELVADLADRDSCAERLAHRREQALVTPLSPDRFIPLAEESGAIVPLGKWVLEESCRQARRWLAEFPDADTFVSVNLAARQIWDSDVVADVAEVLRRTGLPAGLLQLEITESASRNDNEVGDL